MSGRTTGTTKGLFPSSFRFSQALLHELQCGKTPWRKTSMYVSVKNVVLHNMHRRRRREPCKETQRTDEVGGEIDPAWRLG